VFPHPSGQTTPLALRANVEHNQVLHEHVVIVSAQAQNVPHIRQADRLRIDELDHADDGIVYLTIRYGFADRIDVPRSLPDERLGRRRAPGPDLARNHRPRIPSLAGHLLVVCLRNSKVCFGCADSDRAGVAGDRGTAG